MTAAPIPATAADEQRSRAIRLCALVNALNNVIDFPQDKEIANHLIEAAVELTDELVEKWPLRDELQDS